MSYVTQAEVINIIKHSEDIREYELRLEKDRNYNPGSFVQLSLELTTASDIWPDSRTFSIASYEKGIMRFIIKNVGQYTDRIFRELDIGSWCTIKYPFGDLFNKKAINEKHLFLAGGVGVTPYFGLVNYYESIGLIDNITLFYSVKSSKDLLHYNKLKQALGDRLEVFVTREHSEQSQNSRITIDDIMRVGSKDTNIYICGSKSFNDEFRTVLMKNDYRKIHMDEWE